MIQKIEAIVLRSLDYQDSSKILTLFTREFGAMGVIVKGARSSRNKFGASLQPLAHINAVVYLKESRDLQLLTEAELISSFPKIQQDFEKLFLSLSIIELTYMVTRHLERSESLYELVLKVLNSMENATNSTIKLFYYFEARVIGILGFQPSIAECSSCGRKNDDLIDDGVHRVLFEYDRGAFQCSLCLPIPDEENSIKLSVISLWEQLSRTNVNNINEVHWNRETQGELEQLFNRYLEHHQPEMRILRAKQMFDSIRTNKI